MVLFPGNAGAFRRAVVKWPHLAGWLVSPRRSMKALAGMPGVSWAGDNECYTLGDVFDFDVYLRFLWRVAEYPGRCLFVTVPDVVADAEATAARWREYAPAMREVGLPLAYVAQDSLERLPKVDFQALFIGGSTEYKLGPVARRLVREAKAASLWVHMGRVNSIIRMRYAWQIGVDSVDGTGWARRPLGHLGWALRELRWQRAQMPLPGFEHQGVGNYGRVEAGF